jgi:hypothetical protein
MIGTDQFQNKHALANTMNQLQPQKISSNVWVGPLNSVAQHDFLSQNNIKYIFGIMPSHKCCYYLRDLTNDKCCCISIDPNFNINKLTQDEGECLLQFNARFTPHVSLLTENQVTNAVITNINFQRIMEDFLLVLHNIQQKDPSAGILLFSLNGNDNLLSSFVLAYILDTMNCDVPASFSYLRSIRPSVKDFDEMGFYANELVKFYITLKARKKFSHTSPALKSKRSVMDITDHEDAETSSPRNLKRVM